MKILVLCAEPPYPPTHGGARIRLYHLLKHLARFHEITLLTLLESDEDKDHLSRLQPFCKRILSFPKPSPFLKPSIGDRLRHPYYRMIYTAEVASAIQQELSRHRYDLIHVDLAAMAVYTRLLQAHRKVVSATDSLTLGLLNHLPTVTKLKDNLRIRLIIHQNRTYERDLYPNYDACIVVAERDRECIRKECPKLPIHVIPNGTDLEYFTPADRGAEHADQLVFTGTMDYESNVDGAEWFVNEVLPRIEAARPAVNIQLVGRNPSARIAALGKRPTVAVVGFVPDLRPYLATAAVYVCPLRFGSGMKNKILEAMAMGKAIVTTTEGSSGIGGSMGEHYLVTDTADVFASHVLALLEDPIRRKRLGIAARAFVEHRYSWERTGQLMDVVYQQVVKK